MWQRITGSKTPSLDCQGSDEGLKSKENSPDYGMGGLQAGIRYGSPFMNKKGTRRHENINKCCKADIKQHGEVKNKTRM